MHQLPSWQHVPGFRGFGRRGPRIVAMVVVCCLALLGCEGGSRAAPQKPPPPAKPGQLTRTGLLPASARTFAAAATGWSARSGSRLTWSGSTGHASPGALVVTATGRSGTVLSPAFSATAGSRYAASSWVRAASGAGRVAMTVEFFTSTGHRLRHATQVGQRVPATASWHRLLSVVGFAPTKAATARVGLVVKRAGTRTYVDDVTATATSGFAAPVAGPLRTRGPDILDAQGRRVVLRGVEVDGLQVVPQTPLATLLTEVDAARNWGANLVRVPLDPDQLSGPTCVRDPSYLSKIRQLVDAITGHGMVAELDLHVFALRPCKDKPALVTMPDIRAVTFWRQVAKAFKANPRVVFDLYNEPHDVSDHVWRDGGTVSYLNHRYLAVGMQRLYDTVRGTGAGNLIFVGGTNYATDYPSAAPLTGTANLVFSVHVYTCPTGLPSQGHRCAQAGPSGIYDPRTIMRRFTEPSRSLPLVVDEFGFPDRNDGRLDHNVIAYVDQHGWDGWCAFTFDGTSVGLFDLVRNVGPIQNPTVNGMSVMTGLLAN